MDKQRTEYKCAQWMLLLSRARYVNLEAKNRVSKLRSLMSVARVSTVSIQKSTVSAVHGGDKVGIEGL